MPRRLAYDVLRADRPGAPFASELLDTALRGSNLSGPDRGLATEIVYGVIRRRGSLEAILNVFVDRRPPPEVDTVLRIGAYQLLFLDHIPAHAAVHTAVELMASVKPAAKGFVNAVLRNLTRLITSERVSEPAADALPMADGSFRKLTRPVLPSPFDSQADYLACGVSLPLWLVNRWLARFGFLEVLRRGQWFAGPAPLWLRVNPLLCERTRLLEALGERAEPGQHPQAIRLREHMPITELPGFADGWFAVQDESAMAAASALAPAPGMFVLDRCAAPGGKATHLAELMQGQGRVLACDIDPGKLRTIEALAKRMRLPGIEPYLLSRAETAPAGPFDAALVDVPCSNTGVLGRRPEVRWRLSPDDLIELPELQAHLLSETLERVRPGGAVVYSTCSNEPEENGEVIRRVLADHPEWRLVSQFEHTPGRPADGGYWARLERPIT